MKHFTGTICAFLALAMIIAPVSSAHQGNPNYRSEITSIGPEGLTEGIALSVKNFDDGLELVNRSGRTVMVVGYDGEPYLRFSPDGTVEVNLNSPSYYLNEDRFADVEVPGRADPDVAPEWKQVDDTGVSYWHDHRSHYMGEGIPVQVTDESAETEVFDYRIPLMVDGQRPSPVALSPGWAPKAAHRWRRSSRSGCWSWPAGGGSLSGAGTPARTTVFPETLPRENCAGRACRGQPRGRRRRPDGFLPRFSLVPTGLLRGDRPQAAALRIEDLLRAALVPVGMLRASDARDVLDDYVLVADADRVVAALALVELLRDRPDDPDFVALGRVPGQALTAVGEATQRSHSSCS